MPTRSSKKAKTNKLAERKMVFMALAAVLIASVTYLLIERASMAHRLADVDTRLVNLQQETGEQANLLSGEIDSQKALLRPAVVAASDSLAIPELKLTMPYNQVTRTMQYAVDDRGDMRFTSTALTDHTIRQLSCDNLVRVTLQNTGTYSPWEEDAGSIKLADGRTIYIYASKAFANNEASTKACAEGPWKQMSPQQFVTEFKKSQSY